MPALISFYVSPTGLDTNPGTLAAPFLTISHATNVALNTLSGGAQIIINLLPGAWNETVNVVGTPIGGAATSAPGLVFNGAPGIGASIWNGGTAEAGTLIVSGGGNVTVQNISIYGTNCPGQCALFAQVGGIINVAGGMIFGQVNSQHMHAENPGSQIQIFADYTIAAGAFSFNAHAAATTGAGIEWNTPGVITMWGPPMPTYTDAFLTAADNATLYIANGVTWAGGAVGGAKVNITKGAVLDTLGVGVAGIPGTGWNITPGGAWY